MGDSLSGMGGNWALSEQHKGNAAVARANADVARAQGKAERGRAYGQAARIEAENKVAGRQASEAMAGLRAKENEARGQVRAMRGASGFSEQGSGAQAEISVLSQFEAQAQAFAYSRSLQDQSARFSAAMARKSGDLSLLGAEANAGQYDAQASLYSTMARNANRAGNVQGIASGIGLALGTMVGMPQLGMQFGNMVGEVYGAGQMGSMQNLNGMSKGASMQLGAEMSDISSLVGSWLK